MGFLNSCINSRFCLKIRRNETIQRAARRMDKAPNGIWATLPAGLSFTAWILSITSSCLCAFISRSVKYYGPDNRRPQGTGSTLLTDQGIGFWGWQGQGGTCYAYTINGNDPSLDAMFQTAAAMTTATDVLGGICMVTFMLGTVFPVAPKRYEYLGYACLLVSVLAGCTLLILGSNVCNPDFFNYARKRNDSGSATTTVPPFEEISTASCSLGLGSTLAVVGAVFWFLCAFACLRTPLASRKREPGNYRGTTKEDIPENNHETADDEAHRLYRERQAENERRYREMMGDDGSVEERVQQSSQIPYRQPISRLSDVKEEGESADKSHADSRFRHGGHEDDAAEDHSEARSDYSDDDDDHHHGHQDNNIAPAAHNSRYRAAPKHHNNMTADHGFPSSGRGEERSHRGDDSSYRSGEEEMQSLANSELV